ncbi:MAG: DUF523 and DUF1722 domain-containing protein [Gammaproteobacteria bacterium]|nr:DUF523 and DUF1722 domain-containing protein [Gammaproteobacteria bacterium]
MTEGFPSRPEPPLTIAVSECLLGAAVRYDGTDSRSAYPHEALDSLFYCRGICPEVGIGLGVPRAPIRLELRNDSVRAVGVTDSLFDVTDRLIEFARQKAAELDDIAGYVFKENSPSCGLRVKIFPSQMVGRGRYAQVIVEQWPNLPVEESRRLHDPLVRECFVARVFAYAHWQLLLGIGLTWTRIREFQERYECLLIAHSISHNRRANALLDNLDNDLHDSANEYLGLLMAGLSQPAEREGHAHAFEQLLGRMRKDLKHASCEEFERLISRYRRGDESLEALHRLVATHVQEHPGAYAEGQIYLRQV